MEYHLTNGAASSYAASLLGNIRRWLDDEDEVKKLLNKIPFIRREEVCKKG